MRNLLNSLVNFLKSFSLLLNSQLQFVFCMEGKWGTILCYCVAQLPPGHHAEERGGCVARAAQSSSWIHRRYIFYIICLGYFNNAMCKLWFCFCTCDIHCMSSVLGERSFLCGSSWGFLHLSFSVQILRHTEAMWLWFWGFVNKTKYDRRDYNMSTDFAGLKHNRKPWLWVELFSVGLHSHPAENNISEFTFTRCVRSPRLSLHRPRRCNFTPSSFHCFPLFSYSCSYTAASGGSLSLRMLPSLLYRVALSASGEGSQVTEDLGWQSDNSVTDGSLFCAKQNNDLHITQQASLGLGHFTFLAVQVTVLPHQALQ